jgi:hypothetical protein
MPRRRGQLSPLFMPIKADPVQLNFRGMHCQVGRPKFAPATLDREQRTSHSVHWKLYYS